MREISAIFAGIAVGLLLFYLAIRSGKEKKGSLGPPVFDREPLDNLDEGDNMSVPLLAPDFDALSPVGKGKVKVNIDTVIGRKVSVEKAATIYTAMALFYREWIRTQREKAAAKKK